MTTMFPPLGSNCNNFNDSRIAYLGTNTTAEENKLIGVYDSAAFLGIDSLIIKSNSTKYNSYDLIDTDSENLSYLISIATTISERSLISSNNFNNADSISNVHRMDDTNDSHAQDRSNHCHKNNVNNCSSSNDGNDENVDCLIGKGVQCLAYHPTAKRVCESLGGSVAIKDVMKNEIISVVSHYFDILEF